MENLREIIANAIHILTELARRGETITYGDLLEQLGINRRRRPAGQVAAPYLNLVAVYCIAVGVPPLTVLVVNGPVSPNPGQPGDGFLIWFHDVNKARELVEGHDWENSPPPPFPIQP